MTAWKQREYFAAMGGRLFLGVLVWELASVVLGRKDLAQGLAEIEA